MDEGDGDKDGDKVAEKKPARLSRAVGTKLRHKLGA